MTPWRFDGNLVVRRREDDLLCGVVPHDGQAWIAEAKWPQPAVPRKAFATPEAAAAWILGQDPRPAPEDLGPDLRTLPGGAVVRTVAEGPGWSVEAVLRGRPADLPRGIVDPFAPLRLIARKGADREIVAVAAAETDLKRRILVRGVNPKHPRKSRARPCATAATLSPDREDRALEALVRAVRPPPATAHDRLATKDKGAARHRARVLAEIQETRRRLAGTPSR